MVTIVTAAAGAIKIAAAMKAPVAAAAVANVGHRLPRGSRRKRTAAMTPLFRQTSFEPLLAPHERIKKTSWRPGHFTPAFTVPDASGW